MDISRQRALIHMQMQSELILLLLEPISLQSPLLSKSFSFSEVFHFFHLVVERFGDIVIDVVYLAIIRKFAYTPQVGMILI
ncbi:hypothetical protein GQ55_6G180800 [Panicum hallii var. hallii]|uniref:Uncharacterized protein n=1 Tax=Panicum hallii var. hallii TaxID=1504633 RepID=A0A2T7D751_9POAL|nr:hypothetical protein GQ55_6G180800 [Panicum hallii var. hallii]